MLPSLEVTKTIKDATSDFLSQESLVDTGDAYTYRVTIFDVFLDARSD